ncbi:MAG: TetR/AcrR family transcriptional regulator [Bellilinea sp.]|nr:TetR/AcrR family transcriptional regulator [Bellilinea sp.]
MTRREKFRQITIDEIKSLARLQMAEGGTASLSLNAIARQMGMSGPALYRYFENRDALLTTLIVDAYHDLAAALEETASRFAHQTARECLTQILLTYRRWALDHPVDFQLIFGNPIPGYQAEEALTAPSAAKVFAPILRILERAYHLESRAFPAFLAEIPAQLQVGLVTSVQENQPDLPQQVVYIGIVGWYHVHGMIMLELFGHIQPLINDPALFYQFEIERLMDQMNL